MHLPQGQNTTFEQAILFENPRGLTVRLKNGADSTVSNKSFRSLWSPWKMDYSNFCLECVPLMIQIIGLSFKFIQSISSRSQLPETIQQFSGFVYRPEFRPDLDSNFSFQRFNFCHYKLCHVIHMISEGIDSTTTVRCWYTVWWKTKWRLRIFSIPHFFFQESSL